MGEGKAKWVIIFIAHSDRQAQAMQRLLTEEGFLVRLRPVSKAVSAGASCFELLALGAEAREAREVLRENGLI